MMETYRCYNCDITLEAPDPDLMRQKIKEHDPVCPMSTPGAKKGLEILSRMMQMREDDEQRKQAREGN